MSYKQLMGRATARPGDVVPSDSAPAPDDPRDAIVRELAERGPFIDDDQNGYGGSYCADCHVEASQSGPNDPANHEPSCLWRRARVLYPQVDPTTS